MSSTLEEPNRTRTAAPVQQPTRAFLYDSDGDVPEGWELTEPARGSTVRVAFDPRRHTVVHVIGRSTPHESVSKALNGAGFEPYIIDGAQSNFLVRDRAQRSQASRPTPSASSGLGR